MEEFNHLPQISEQLARAASQIVRKAAFDIQARAASTAPVDTGLLRSSIYVETSDSSSYGRGVTGDKGDMLPEVSPPQDDQTAIVAVGANYGLYVEMGTRHSPAQPYLVPAVMAIKESFERAMSKLESALK